MPNHQLNDHQEKFLLKMVAAQKCSTNTIKCVQEMQLRIKEFEKEIREDERNKIKKTVKNFSGGRLELTTGE